MKIKITFILCIIVFISCDKLLTEEFIVDNSYYNSVSIKLENMNGEIVDTIIPPYTEDFKLLINTGFGQSVHEFEVSRLFKYFIVKSDTILSTKDYLDNSLWEYKEYSETLAEFRLNIDSTCFENE